MKHDMDELGLESLKFLRDIQGEVLKSLLVTIAVEDSEIDVEGAIFMQVDSIYEKLIIKVSIDGKQHILEENLVGKTYRDSTQHDYLKAVREAIKKAIGQLLEGIIGRVVVNEIGAEHGEEKRTTEKKNLSSSKRDEQ